MSNKPGDGRRVARMEKEIQQAIAQFLLRDVQRELPGLVTVSSVKMPGDLRTAKVAISLIATGGGDEAKLRKEAVKILQQWAPEVQHHLAAELNLRFVPKLTFIPDETTDRILHVENVLRRMGGKGKE